MNAEGHNPRLAAARRAGRSAQLTKYRPALRAAAKRKAPLLVLILTCISSCTHLPLGRVDDFSHDARMHICLIRGFQDWYSTGIDTLADQLRTDGFDAQAFGESQWHDLAATLAASTDQRKPLVLIGFSYGADDVISISRLLSQKHIPVDLLITIDPVTPATVPSNVRQCVNFYESNGFWDIFPWLRGVPLHRDSRDLATMENVNIRNRPDLNEPDTRHATIAANPKVHRAIIDLVKMEQARLAVGHARRAS